MRAAVPDVVVRRQRCLQADNIQVLPAYKTGVRSVQLSSHSAFLDDLQWLDAAILDLLEYLLTQQDLQHPMMIGACSVTRLISTHPLMRKLEAIRQAGTVAQDIVVAPLTGEDLGQLICGFSSLRTGAQHPPPATDPPQDGGQSIFRYPVQVRTRGRRPTHFQSWRRVMVLGRESHSRARFHG
jgi:hypothetical protein